VPFVFRNTLCANSQQRIEKDRCKSGTYQRRRKISSPVTGNRYSVCPLVRYRQDLPSSINAIARSSKGQFSRKCSNSLRECFHFLMPRLSYAKDNIRPAPVLAKLRQNLIQSRIRRRLVTNTQVRLKKPALRPTLHAVSLKREIQDINVSKSA
jgi:hypothetical protein